MFHNRGEPEYLLGLADLMTRNIDYRVEVLCPIRDPAIQNQLQDILDQQWHDNTKARVLDKTRRMHCVTRQDHPRAAGAGNDPSLPLWGKKPRMPRSLMKQASKRRRRRRRGRSAGRKQPGFNVSLIQNHNLLRSRSSITCVGSAQQLSK